MTEFEPYQRKTFPVTAARVTPLNIEELAKACGGTIHHDGEKEGQLSRDYIKVRVQYPINERQTEAHVGDWLVKQNRNFKVYQDKPFRNTFEKPGDQSAQKQPRQGPSPASMPKHVETSTPEPIKHEPVEDLTDGPVEVTDGNGAVIEQTPPEGTTPPTLEETPQFPENSPEEKLVETPVTDEVVVERVEQVHNHASTERCDENGCQAERYVDGTHVFTDKTVEAEPPVEEKHPITLDELNDMTGDPRSTQEIMREGH